MFFYGKVWRIQQQQQHSYSLIPKEYTQNNTRVPSSDLSLSVFLRYTLPCPVQCPVLFPFPRCSNSRSKRNQMKLLGTKLFTDSLRLSIVTGSVSVPSSVRPLSLSVILRYTMPSTVQHPSIPSAQFSFVPLRCSHYIETK
jgi:hypothetical protein